MANQWFQFKQFKINQDRTAMKVGTDGVLLGAWANFSQSTHILDIGTGTGLIAIMAAQRTNKSKIAGVEIDEGAFKQAEENVLACKWSDRILLYHQDFNFFAQTSTRKYDHIVSNPPFFNSTLKPPQNSRATARHNESLSLDELIKSSALVLAAHGRISLILPTTAKSELQYICQINGLFISTLTFVKPTPGKPPHRMLVELSYKYEPMEPEELIIEEFGRHQYSAAYRQLTYPFYL